MATVDLSNVSQFDPPMNSLSNPPLKLESFEFHGHSIEVGQVNERPHVVIKSIADAIGLHAQSALSSLRNDEILGKYLSERHVISSKKGPKKRIMMPIERVEGWLFSIDSKKVKPEIKPILLEFKESCFTALHDYFNGNTAMHRAISQTEKQLIDENIEINGILRKLKARLHFNSSMIDQIREQRFVAYRLFDDSPTQDEEFKQIVEKVTAWTDDGGQLRLNGH